MVTQVQVALHLNCTTLKISIRIFLDTQCMSEIKFWKFWMGKLGSRNWTETHTQL